MQLVALERTTKYAPHNVLYTTSTT